MTKSNRSKFTVEAPPDTGGEARKGRTVWVEQAATARANPGEWIRYEAGPRRPDIGHVRRAVGVGDGIEVKTRRTGDTYSVYMRTVDAEAEAETP